MTQFCQYVEGRRRCVLALHGSDVVHELQPFSSASVRAIQRQEELDAKLTGTPARVVREIDKAQEESSASSQEASTATTVSESAPAPVSTAETTQTSSPSTRPGANGP